MSATFIASPDSEITVGGVFNYGDYAPDGDHHDVNCLRTLANDYYPNGVQERAL